MKEMVSLQAFKNFISFHLVFVMMNFFDMRNTSMLHHCRYEYMVVVITSTCAIGANQQYYCEFKPRMCRGVLGTLCETLQL
jgi:hypothetical protein